MCDLNGPFRLCTCSDDVEYTKPHWIMGIIYNLITLHKELYQKTNPIS